MRRDLLTKAGGGLSAVLVAAALWLQFAPPDDAAPLVLCPVNMKCRHVHDIAGALPGADLPLFEQYMDQIHDESDIDVRFVFVPNTGTETLENLAVKVVDQLRIGGRNREQRGVLLLFDMQSRRLKIEVGYGLEAYLPDLFVSYLVHEHARLFFESGDLSKGLQLLLRIMQHRIRESVLGNDFDPRALEGREIAGQLSGGAGVTASMNTTAEPRARLTDAERATYAAGDSVLETYQTYVRWLMQPIFDPAIDLFTANSRRYLSRLPITPAYADYIRFGEIGKKSVIVQRGELAILYFVGTPFTSPHFFRREDGKWRMDMIAEIRNTEEISGGEFSWSYRINDDPHTRAFADLLIDIRGYQRFRDGDNRALPTRKSPSAASSAAPSAAK